jgi:hypothetical protein
MSRAQLSSGPLALQQTYALVDDWTVLGSGGLADDNLTGMPPVSENLTDTLHALVLSECEKAANSVNVVCWSGFVHGDFWGCVGTDCMHAGYCFVSLARNHHVYVNAANAARGVGACYTQHWQLCQTIRLVFGLWWCFGW